MFVTLAIRVGVILEIQMIRSGVVGDVTQVIPVDPRSPHERDER